MRKFIFFFLTFVLCGLISIQSEASIELDDSFFILGDKSNESQKAGVKDVSYLLFPVEDNGVFLTWHHGSLKLSSEISKRSLFIFEEAKPSYYYVKNRELDRLLKDGRKDKCYLNIKKDNSFELIFREYEDDRLDTFLHYDSKNKSAHFSTEASLWSLQSVYNFLELNPEFVDLNTLLFQIPRKESISNQYLTAAQIQALYSLHYSSSPHKALAIVKETPEFVFGYTAELFYVKGLYLFSEDFPLKIFNIKDFKQGRGNSHQEALQTAQPKKEDSIEINKNAQKILFLQPSYEANSDVLPLMGEIEITPGNLWLGGLSVSYSNLRVRLKDIIYNKGITLYSNFAINFKDNIINFIDINKNFLTNPGTTLFVTQYVSQEVIKSLGKEAFKSVDRFALSIENFGDSIEKASKSAERAWIESSKNFSDAIVYSANSLAETIIFASKTFENSVKFLSLTAKGISEDITANRKALQKSIDSTSKLLSDSLIETSKNLEKGAKEVANSLKESSQFFEKAFEEISSALESSSKDISKSIEKASGDFVQGMEKIEQAAKEMKDTKHRIEICTVS